MNPLKKIPPIIGLLIILLVSGYFYLYPGTRALLEKRTDLVMSDGTDPLSAPRQYELLDHYLKNKPSRLLYGAVWADVGDPEHGYTLTIPFNERILVLIFAQLFPVEQVSTAFIFALMILNGLCMYLLCRYMDWSKWISYALSFAWAFNAYTRARAKVHGGFVGNYHLPLIFLGLLLIVRGKSKKSLIADQIALLIAGTVAHYYVITCMFLAPLFILYIYFQPEFRKDMKQILRRFALASIPLMLFLAANYAFMLPPEAPLSKEASMKMEVTEDGTPHPFLQVFHARPIDYLAGDIALIGDADLNPLRGIINQDIKENIGYGNTHERTNGIRWSVIFLSILTLVFLFKGQFKADPFTHRNVIYFLIFGFFTFWISLAPDIPTVSLNPSYWLYRIMPKIRVSTRAGIMVHFSLLMLVGFLLSQKAKNWKWKKILLYPGVLLAVFAIDYFPSQEMPMARVYPAYESLKRDNGPCEVGMVFPFINNKTTTIMAYTLMQQMRGTDCKIINETDRVDQLQLLHNKFPPDINFINNIQNNVGAAVELEKLVKCMPLNWIIFLDPTPISWAESICQRLGWGFEPTQRLCTAAQRNQPMKKLPSHCL